MNKGKVYRIGGDEFMIIINLDNPEELKAAIKQKSNKWKGVYNPNLFLAIGYASVKGNQGSSIDKLEHIADTEMYKDKSLFYQENGIDRRRR